MPETAPLYVTRHAQVRWSQRISKGPLVKPKRIAVLAADAKPPTDDQWRVINRRRRAREDSRDHVRVLGSIVFVVVDDRVITV